MLKFAICDDNDIVNKKLYQMFEKIFLKHDYPAEVIFTCTTADEMLSYASKNKIDVFILDINLHSNISGLEIAKRLRSTNKDCYIIFATAYLEYVLMAFKYKTFDYIPKPITMERLEDTVIRLFDDINGTNKKYIRIDNKNTIIHENEIEYIKREGMKVVFHTVYRDYEIYSSFSKIEDTLPDTFVRCHKSFIANIKNITKLETNSNTVYFSNNSSCNIGPKYKQQFLNMVKKYNDLQ